jgi:hypothetical protein
MMHTDEHACAANHPVTSSGAYEAQPDSRLARLS